MFAPPTRAAELTSLLDRPYKLQIVLRFAEHRVLTPVFKEQAALDIRNQLRLAFGALAEVEVLRQHPFLAEIHAKGLEQALDAWHDLSDAQTHFVLIDYQAGRFTMRSRVHDGATGLNSPTVRRAETGDLSQLADLVVRQIHDGLAIAGTVVKTDPGIEVALQGGSLNAPLERWVQPGDVFAVTRILEDGAALRAIPLTWALLRISSSPKQGVCRAEYFHRYEEDALTTGAPQVAGYRCLKLPAAKMPLSLRFLDAESLQPLSGLQVHIGRRGFQDTVRELSTDITGLSETRESFENAAFVKIVSGGKARAQFPIALIEPRTIVCRLKLEPQAEMQAVLVFQRDRWHRRTVEALLFASSKMGQLNTVLGHSLESAHTYAQSSLKDLDRDLASLDAERRELQRQAERKEQRLDFGEGDQRLAELRKRREELAGFVARLQTNIQESKSDKTLGSLKLLERARLVEANADYEQAISLYEEFLDKNAGQAKILEHLKSLKKAWQVKNEEHKQARAFIYQEWQNLDPAGLKSKLERARQAFKICREHGDTLTLRKLLQENLTHVANLRKRLTNLQTPEGQENRTEARLIAEVAEGLRQLHAEATECLRAQ